LERNLMSPKKQKILIYCEPEYRRKFDVEFQTQLILKTYNSMIVDGPKEDFVFYYDDYDEFVKNLIERIVNR